MLDYEKKYADLTSGLNRCIPDVSQEFPDANGFEKAVIAMRRLGWNYGDIQKKLGMPSKKDIRNALLKWAPHLIDNSKSKIINMSEYEAGIYSLLYKTDKTDFEFEDDDWKFFIKDKAVWYQDPSGQTGQISEWNEVNIHQMYNVIKEQLNGLDKSV